MKKLVLIIITGLVLAGAAFGQSYTVQSLTGRVEAELGGKWKALKAGDTLEAESNYGICPVCGWEDDPIQNNDPAYEGGANSINLTTARQAFLEGKALRPLKKAAYQRLVTLLREDEPEMETAQAAVL